MSVITLGNITPPTPSVNGWTVGYRIKGNTGPYTVENGFMAQPIIINTLDPINTSYEGYIINDCSNVLSEKYYWEMPIVIWEPLDPYCETLPDVVTWVGTDGYCEIPAP